MGTKIKKYWVDGACSGNPGPGGYAVVSLEENELVYSYIEDFPNTTNNRMELMAILHVIKLAAEDKENDYLVYSDSAYAINCLINWCPMWAKNNWRRKGNKPILNLELIQEMYSIYLKIKDRITIIKIGGHKGVLGNELADALAANNRKKFDDLIYKNNIILLNMLDK